MESMISAKNDVVFKVLFSRNKELLREFLNDVLNISIESVIAPPIRPCQIGRAIIYLKRHFARRSHGNRKIWRIDFGKLYLPHL